ncbi:MAG: ROK family protein, partial [Deltaproteobacteria bacterium]|nr:ROK family protein [Deltaproteobacteria bacterium]
MILGIDLGGTKLLAACVDAEGALVATRRWATGRETTPARLLALLREVVAWS